MKLRNIPFSPPDMTEARGKRSYSFGLDNNWSKNQEAGAGDFGVRAYGQDRLPELGYCGHGDGAAPAGCGPWR